MTLPLVALDSSCSLKWTECNVIVLIKGTRISITIICIYMSDTGRPGAYLDVIFFIKKKKEKKETKENRLKIL